VRERMGPLKVKPEHALISGYFNLDNGGGKLLGIYAENNAAMVPIFDQWMAIPFRPEAGGSGRSDIHLQHHHARSDAASKAVAGSRTL
jgi:hypothetical protein